MSNNKDSNGYFNIVGAVLLAILVQYLIQVLVEIPILPYIIVGGLILYAIIYFKS